jgi:phosphoglycolate phosphatase
MNFPVSNSDEQNRSGLARKIVREVSASFKMSHESKETRLLLWDIDGTLINSGGAGVRALQLAGTEQFGIEEDLQGIEIAGRTDSGIVRQILAKRGSPLTDENVRMFLDRYVKFLARELPLCKGRVLPGILELFSRFEARPDITLGLLTGNVARGARLKLDHYGLWKFFAFGAFADDHHDRNELGAVACARAFEKTGRQFRGGNVDVIGDTGHDIACGKAIDARTIAVATGSWPRERLAKCEPDFLFDDLSKVAQVVATLSW